MIAYDVVFPEADRTSPELVASNLPAGAEWDPRAYAAVGPAEKRQGVRRSPSNLAVGPSVIAFAIITETVFQWPGMGLLFVQAVQNVDMPIMAAYLMLVALIFVAINLAVDILYTVVDPRLRDATIRLGRLERVTIHGSKLTECRIAASSPPDACSRRPFLDSDVWASFRRSKLTWSRLSSRCCSSWRRSWPAFRRRRTLSIRRNSS